MSTESENELDIEDVVRDFLASSDLNATIPNSYASSFLTSKSIEYFHDRVVQLDEDEVISRIQFFNLAPMLNSVSLVGFIATKYTGSAYKLADTVGMLDGTTTANNKKRHLLHVDGDAAYFVVLPGLPITKLTFEEFISEADIEIINFVAKQFPVIQAQAGIRSVMMKKFKSRLVSLS